MPGMDASHYNRLSVVRCHLYGPLRTMQFAHLSLENNAFDLDDFWHAAIAKLQQFARSPPTMSMWL